MRVQPKGINWNAKGRDRVAQNVRNLLSLTQYEVAYNRLLGLPADAIDIPSEAAAEAVSQAAREMIQRFEPRARVTGISPKLDAEGDLQLEVDISFD